MPAPQVLLVHPFSGDWERMRSSPFLPLNLIHAATEVHGRFPVRIVDLRREKSWRRTLGHALDEPTALVGLTSMTGTMIASALEVAAFVRERSPSTPLVWGGMHASLLPEQTAAHPLVDAVAIADGERILLELAERAAGGEPLVGAPGTVVRRGDEVVRGPAAPLPDLDALPDPPFELVDVPSYMPLWDGETSLSFEASRGCPRPCTFCYNTALDPGRYRMLDAGRAVQRLERLVRAHAPGNVYLVDDNFILKPAWALEIAEGLARIGVSWQTQGADIPSIARIDDATLDALAATGLKRISIGIESGSPRIRKRMRKAASVDRIKHEIARLARHPIVLYCSFFVGSPTETLEDVRATVDLVLELHRLNPHVRNSPFYIYLPLPGTAMLDDAVAQGHRAPTNLEGWSHLTFDMESSLSRVGWSEGLSLEQTRALYFTSMFLDRKGEFGMPRVVAWLAGLYRPIAAWRLRHFVLGGLVELGAYRAVHAVWMGLEALRRRRRAPDIEGHAAPARERVPAVEVPG